MIAMDNKFHSYLAHYKPVTLRYTCMSLTCKTNIKLTLYPFAIPFYLPWVLVYDYKKQIGIEGKTNSLTTVIVIVDTFRQQYITQVTQLLLIVQIFLSKQCSQRNIEKNILIAIHLVSKQFLLIEFMLNRLDLIISQP